MKVLKAETPHRSNPAVTQKAALVFQHIVQALESEMIQGQIANKVAASAKHLVAQTGLNAEQILQTLTPEGQAAIKTYFQ